MWLACVFLPYFKLSLAFLLLHAPPFLVDSRIRGAMLDTSNYLAKWCKVSDRTRNRPE